MYCWVFVDWTACNNVSSLGSDRSDTGDGSVWAGSTSVVSGRGSVGVSVWLGSLPASQHHCMVFTHWQGRRATSDAGQVSDWWKGSYHHHYYLLWSCTTTSQQHLSLSPHCLCNTYPHNLYSLIPEQSSQLSISWFLFIINYLSRLVCTFRTEWCDYKSK